MTGCATAYAECPLGPSMRIASDGVIVWFRNWKVNLNKRPLLYILFSASLFGASPPLAKMLVRELPPVALAGFLYIGAFLGLSVYSLGSFILLKGSQAGSAILAKRDYPWGLAGAILSGGIVAPISLLFGLERVSGVAGSLLLNLEGVLTALIAVFLFGESAGKRLWWALACMTAAGVFLTWEPVQGRFIWSGFPADRPCHGGVGAGQQPDPAYLCPKIPCRLPL